MIIYKKLQNWLSIFLSKVLKLMTNLVAQAALYCQKNNLAQLQALVPSQISVDSIVPSIKLTSTLRKNVPLLCIAVASNSVDVTHYLLKLGAKLDLADII